MNKKWLIIGGIVVVCLLAIFTISMANFSLSNPFLDGQQENAKLGSLIIPVTATGTVEAARLIAIKSKAGGIVQSVPVVAGQMVKEGDILVQLDPVDEKRNVQARQADLDRATALLEQAKIKLRNAELDLPLQTKTAAQRIKDGEAKQEMAEFSWHKMEGYAKDANAGDVEVKQAKTTFDATKAALEMAKINYEQAKNNEDILLNTAKQDVVQASATVTAAQKGLDEAKLRLDETVVKAKSAGMVYSIQIHEGETIQSGTMTFTGGTLLMVLADVSSMFVIAQIDEADIGAIRDIAPTHARPGQMTKLSNEELEKIAKDLLQKNKDKAVTVTVEAYRSQDYQGVIDAIDPEPQIVNNARAFKVRVRLIGEDLQKLNGLQADLSFTTDKIDNVVLVKNEALASEGRDCYVYIPYRPSGHGRWDEKKVPVKIGKTDGTYTEIVSGLKSGDAVWIKRPQKTEKEKKMSDQA